MNAVVSKLAFGFGMGFEVQSLGVCGLGFWVWRVLGS